MDTSSSILPPYAVECVLGLVSVALLYYFAYSPFNYWKKRGVAQIDVQYPFIGNALKTFLTPIHISRQWGYKEFPNERFVGTYDNRKPTLLIRDPDLIESVLIKDFSHLSDRTNRDDPNAKMAKNLLNLTGDQWKHYRNKLTPTFSTGKLKGMHSQLTDCGNSLIKFMKSLDDGRPFEVRDVIQRFTMDVIASCAFGLNIDTINDPDSEFRKAGQAIFKPTLWGKIVFGLRLRPLIRKITQITKFNFFQNSKVGQFFSDAIDTTIEHRKKNNLTRHDFLHLMNELMEKDKADPNNPFPFDHNALVSNAFVFFLAGFETTATTVSYAMYLLALNEDAQEKAYQEVSRVLKKHGGEASFNAIQEMEYLEQVISETLRIYPPAVALSRAVTKPYEVPGTSGLVLPAGSTINIPTYALHHDPQYFPEPEKFIPERFDESNNSIRKGTYLPFGGGPRICIGARFAKMEAAVCLAMLIQNYHIAKCSQTKIPLDFDQRSFLLVPKGGIWLTVRPRAAAAS
ncbi:cytochrome P450 [Nesidiocoris tenuis]|uniref:Cytochrome P450 n=1 Tax=Nesidiocoris tenuis TaxID=355587 RepID=A0ABN7AC46_9HEMI|nr:cytochrome P450 [Nesidiocoris tenuis]